MSVTLCRNPKFGGNMKNYSTAKPRASTEIREPAEHKEAPETIIVSDTLPRVLEKLRKRWNISTDQKSDGEIFACWMTKKLETCRGEQAKALQCITLDEIVANISPYCENKGLILKKSAAKVAFEILVSAHGKADNIRDISECTVGLLSHDYCLEAAEEIILDKTFVQQIKLFRKKFGDRYAKFSDTELLICWMTAVLKSTKDKRAKVLMTVPIAELRENIFWSKGMSEIHLFGISALMLQIIVSDHYEYAMSDYDFSQYAAWLFEENFRLHSNPETD